MASSIIDGRIVGAKLKRASPRRSIFATIIFQLPDGSRRTFHNLAAETHLAIAITPGTSGRFYLHSVLDQAGVHGMRTHEGRALFGFPGVAERLSFAAALVGLILAGGLAPLQGEVGATMLALAMLAAGAGLTLRRARRGACDRFEADSGVAVHDGLSRGSVSSAANEMLVSA